MATSFQKFVNKELPKRIYTNIKPTDLSANLVPYTTGIGLGVEFIDLLDLKDGSVNNVGSGDGLISSGRDASGNILLRTLKGIDSITVDTSGNTILIGNEAQAGNYVKEASLGDQFYWDDNELKIDVSGGVTDPSIDALYEKVGVYDYDSSNFINQSYDHTKSISELDKILALLTPAPPDSLSEKTLSNPGYYSANVESTFDTVSNITDDNTPTSSVSNFLKETEIYLNSVIDGELDGSIFITDSDMDGQSNESLAITNDEDAYSGDSQREGFYRVLGALISAEPALDASVNQHTYNLQYPDSGNETGTVSFYVDDPTTPSISDASITNYNTSLRYISGVPSYADGDTLDASFNVVDAVGKFYNPTTLATLDLNVGDSRDTGLPGTAPSEGDTVSFDSETLTFGNNEYAEHNSIELSIIPYNSKGSYSAGEETLNIPGRIDTVSDESDRVLSGLGEFPDDADFGDPFDSSVSLKSGDYNAELQKLNGLYQWPSGDYSSWESGPDYTSGLGSDTRWVTIPFTISDKTGFNIQFNNTSNFTADENNITQDIKIYANVVGSKPTNGWIDCNEPYDGSDSDVTDDGEGAMEVGNSTATYKSCTFGSTLKSGTIYIRIGLEPDSTLSFSDIDVTF
ncbi:MAG: hypothetical protein ACOCZ5_00895 [bacterium]